MGRALWIHVLRVHGDPWAEDPAYYVRAEDDSDE